MAAIREVERLDTDEGGMGYLQSLPRRVVTVYLPLLVFLIVLLFP
ncbi:MAG: carbohydrate ABC transporter permease, partial [Mesorhizobium sp.]